MIPDYKIDCGPRLGKLKAYSIAHLRIQNSLRWYSPQQLLELIDRPNIPKCDLTRALQKRLQSIDKRSDDDIDLIEDLIMTGHGEGLASSPHYPFRTDIFWQGAALILEQYGVEHVNDIPRD